MSELDQRRMASLLYGGTPRRETFGSNVRHGENFQVGPGTVIGSIGFGYEKVDGEWQLREHPFGVEIGDDVSIGANTVIDRGRHRDTSIGDGTKIDNLCHIAHNVQIGKRCLVIALSQIAGSCEIGDDVIIGPAATITDHTKVGDGARIGMGAVVLRDVPAGETWVGNPAKRLRSKDESGGLQRLTQLLDLDRPGVEWRHDVDYDLNCAVQMAAFERRRGVRSTYYLRPGCAEYEITPEVIGAFTSLGHEIGTHVDLRAPRDAVFSDAQLILACGAEEQRLRDHGGPNGSTRKISFHQPPLDVLNRRIPGFDSAHAPDKGLYVGDSRGVFVTSPENALRLIDQPVQMNLHPEWWFLPPEEAAKLREREAGNP